MPKEYRKKYRQFVALCKQINSILPCKSEEDIDRLNKEIYKMYQLDNDASIYYDRELYIDCNFNKSKVRELLFTDKVHFEANEDVEEHVGIVLRYKLSSHKQ